jgi:hypothetical protein
LYTTHGSSEEVEYSRKHMRKQDIEAQKGRGWGQGVKEKRVPRLSEERETKREIHEMKRIGITAIHRVESRNTRYMRSHETGREL